MSARDAERASLASEAAAFQRSSMVTLPLAAGETASLFEDVGEDRAGWTIRGGFAIAGPDEPVATVTVRGPWGRVDWAGTRRQSGMFALQAARGTYEVRITNHGGDKAALTLGWAVGGDRDNPLSASGDRGGGGPRHAGLAAGGGADAVAARMARSASAIHEALDTAAAEMQSHAVRMRRNEMTGESTAWRLNMLNLAEVGTVLALAVAQACIVRHLARTSLAMLSDPSRKDYLRGSRRYAPIGMV